jgi:hypothetical protein
MSRRFWLASLCPGWVEPARLRSYGQPRRGRIYPAPTAGRPTALGSSVAAILADRLKLVRSPEASKVLLSIS